MYLEINVFNLKIQDLVNSVLSDAMMVSLTGIAQCSLAALAYVRAVL